MIIPIRCFTCGNVLADKYRFYKQEVRRLKFDDDMKINKVRYLTMDDLLKEKIQKTPEGIVLDKLKLTEEQRFVVEHNPGHAITHIS